MVSKLISIDIVKYLQKEKELSVDEIAQSMGTSASHIKDVLKAKKPLTPENITTYLKSSDMHFWEFAIAAIPLNHLPEKTRDKILLCKEISTHIKKKRKI